VDTRDRCPLVAEMDTSRQDPEGIAGKSEWASTVGRQRRSIAEKRRIVEETLVSGASVAKVAWAHGVNANQVFGWRRLYVAGRLGEPKPGIKLLPVRVSESKSAPVVVEHRVTDVCQPQPGTIHIELRQAQVRIEGRADPPWCGYCWSAGAHDRIAGEDADLDRGGNH
jgi:transposase